MKIFGEMLINSILRLQKNKGKNLLKTFSIWSLFYEIEYRSMKFWKCNHYSVDVAYDCLESEWPHDTMHPRKHFVDCWHLSQPM